jgi:TnpA family transposase
VLLERTPFQFAQQSPLGRAVTYVRAINRLHGRKLAPDAPIEFLPPRWVKHVVRRDRGGTVSLSRPHYEPALLTTLNERLKSGDVTVAGSRRWTDFEDYLIPRPLWADRQAAYYAALGLPLDVDHYFTQLNEALGRVTAAVDRRVPYNQALRIDSAQGEFHLAALKGIEKPDAVKHAKELIQARLARIDLVDLLIEIDNETNMLAHCLRHPEASRLSPAVRRRNVLAALVAVGCNIGPQRMALASGLSGHDISFVADWYLTEEALKAASVDLVNFATRLPMSRVYGQGTTCSADGMRFYVPVNILAADYSHVLHGRGVTLFAHTSDTYLRFHQQPIPCRLREAAFSLDGLLEHDTELNPKVCYTDTHGYTEVVMAVAALLGFELAPRIKDIKDQTLYKMDRQQRYPNLDPILTGTVKTHLVRQAWDETVRLIASIQDRIVSASLLLHRLGSYARQNSIHQALAEIGRVHKTIHILKTLDDEDYRRRMGRELNKGEASHALSRFLCFGKEGAMRGREFGDQLHTFSCLSVLHNAVVAWNTLHIGRVVDELRAEGYPLDDATLNHTTPLVHKHINPFGRYHFDVERMRQTIDPGGKDS